MKARRAVARCSAVLIFAAVALASGAGARPGSQNQVEPAPPEKASYAPQPTPAPAGKPAAAPQLTARQRADRLRALPDEERHWLTEFVAPIILPEEERLFLEIVREEHRLVFKEEFWKRRERDGLRFPLGPGYRGRYEELRRLADTTYDGWKSDAGRTVIAHGEPAAIDMLEGCRLTFRGLEIWTYPPTAGFPAAGRHFFYRSYPLQPRHLWNWATPESEVLSPQSCRKSFQEMSKDCVPADPNLDHCSGSACNEGCDAYHLWTEIRSRQGGVGGANMETLQMLSTGGISTEGLELLRERMATSATPGAKTIALDGPATELAQQAISPKPSPSILPSPAPTPAGKPAAAPQPPFVQTRVVPKLTARQRAERLRELPDEERQWLKEYVEPIILADEVNLFLQLSEPYQREAFKREFWSRRERDGLKPPLGPGYEARYRNLLEVAAEEYDGIHSDAGRMVVKLGEPAAIEVLDGCSEVFRQAEVWTYPTAASSRAVNHLFYRPSFGGPRRLWLPGDNEIFQTASCIASFDQACATDPNGVPQRSASAPCGGSASVPRTCRAACAAATIAQEIQGRGLAAEGSLANSPPAVSTEGLEGLWQRYATLSNPAAKTIAVEGRSSVSAGPAPSKAPAPEEPQPGWSSEDIRNRIVALPKKYRDWLDLAGPLLSEADLIQFLQLPPSGRDGFMRKFWKVHAHSK